MKTTVWYLLVICLIKVKEMVNYIFANKSYLGLPWWLLPISSSAPVPSVGHQHPLPHRLLGIHSRHLPPLLLLLLVTLLLLLTLNHQQLTIKNQVRHACGCRPSADCSSSRCGSVADSFGKIRQRR